MKTIKLPDRPRGDRPERMSDILTGVFIIGVLLFARDTLNGQPAQQIKVVTLKPAILIQRETSAPQPTWTPAPTSEPQVIYITLPTPEPQVIYVESAPATAQDSPGQPEAVPEVVQDVAPTLAPRQLVILDRQQWAVQAATARAGR